MKLDLHYDKNAELFRSVIEIPNIADVRLDAIYNMTSMLFDQLDFINDILRVINTDLTNHEIVGCIEQEHDEKTLKSFMIFAVENNPSIIKVSWGPTINRVDIDVYEPAINGKPKNVHGFIHLYFEHETAPIMKYQSDDSSLIEELVEKIQENVIDGYHIEITEFIKPDGNEEY